MAKTNYDLVWTPFDLGFEASEKKFKEFETQGKVELSDEIRSELLEAMRLHTLRYSLEIGAVPTNEVIAPIKVFRDAATKLSAAIDKLYDRSAVSNVALAHIQSSITGDHRLMQARDTASAFTIAGEKAIAKASAVSLGGRGPRSLPDFELFILDLAVLYRNAGGRPSASYSPNSTAPGGRDTPFIRFAWAISQALSEPAEIAVTLQTHRKAFAEAVNAILQKNKKKAAKEEISPNEI